MKRRAFLLGSIAASPAAAQTASWQPVVMVPHVSGGSYTGPGDIITFAGWYGLRAYNAAYATGSKNAVNVRRASDNTTTNIVILANGNLDVATALSFAGTDASGIGSITGTALTFTGGHIGDTITGGTTASGTYIVSGSSPTWTVNISQTVVSTTLTLTWGLFVTELYDQSGSGNHATQATTSLQPQLITTGGPSTVRPYMLFTGAPFLATSAVANTNQPYTYSAVALCQNAGGEQYIISHFDGGAGSGIMSFRESGVPGNARMYAGGDLNFSTTDGVWHAMNGVFNGASSSFAIDGSTSTGNPGGAPTASTPLGIGADGSGVVALAGGIGEAGIAASAPSSGLIASLNSNQHTYWGF